LEESPTNQNAKDALVKLKDMEIGKPEEQPLMCIDGESECVPFSERKPGECVECGR